MKTVQLQNVVDPTPYKFVFLYKNTWLVINKVLSLNIFFRKRKMSDKLE